MERQHFSECKTIRHLIDAMAELNGADPDKIIDLLKDYLWTEDELKVIKGSNDKLRGE